MARRIHLPKLGLLAGLLALSIAACTPQEPIRIGIVAGLSGRNIDLGEGGRNGALLAIEQQNKAGGINGRLIEPVIRDDGNDPEKAASAARDLIKAKVALIVGPFNSSMSAAMLPVIDPANMVLLSPTASALSFAGKDDHFIRTNWTTRDNARLYADWMYSKRNLKTAAIAFDLQNKVFSESWVAEFSKAYGALGGKITSQIHYDARIAAHYSKIADTLLHGKPDCLLFVANSPDTARLSQQVRKSNRHIPLFASEWADVDQVIEAGGKAVEGLTIVQAFDRNNTSPRYREFVTAYKERFKKQPGYTSVAAYDAMHSALHALSMQDKNQSIKQAILLNSPYQGLQKEIVLDQFGDAHQRAFMSIIQNGQARILP